MIQNIKKVGIKAVSFGKNVTVIEPVNIYGCSICEKTFIGPFVEIQKDVIICENCKIQSHSFMCELVKIGNIVLLANGVMFINDLFSDGGPARGDKSKWKHTNIGDFDFYRF